MLNIRAEFDTGSGYTVEIFRGSEKADMVSPQIWNGTPLAKGDLDFSYHIKNPKVTDENSVKSVKNDFPTATASVKSDSDEDEKEYGWMEIELTANELVKMDTKSGRFIFEKDGLTVIMTRQRQKTFNFDAF